MQVRPGVWHIVGSPSNHSGGWYCYSQVDVLSYWFCGGPLARKDLKLRLRIQNRYGLEWQRTRNFHSFNKRFLITSSVSSALSQV